MKIEVAESLMYTWLRHVKGCRIVQTNWKSSPLWDVDNISLEFLRNVAAEIQNHFKTRNLKIFKNDQDVAQVLRQVECDVLGVSQESGKTTYYAVESAFHENGLNYGSKEITCAKVISKMTRIAFALKLYFSKGQCEIIFAAPKIYNNIMQILPEAISDLNAIFKKHSIDCSVRLIENDKYLNEILEPVIKISNQDVSDTAEIFLRSLQLINLFDRGHRFREAPVRNIEEGGLKEHIALNEHELNDNPFANLPVGKIAKIHLRQWLERECTAEEAERFLDEGYSTRQFQISFPLLQRTRTPDRRGYFRHSPNPLIIHGQTYYLCTQWYDRHRANLINWLRAREKV